MNAVLVLILFVGMALVVHSVYEEKFRRLKSQVKVEYRFVPRTFYEEQLAQTDVSGHFKSMFNDASPWPGEAMVPGKTLVARADSKKGAKKSGG